MYTLRKRRSKYINSQRHKTSCGPIAVANLIKWAGIETSYKKVRDFCLSIRAYSKIDGMWPYQMSYVLQTLKMEFQVRRSFSTKALDALLSSGGSCILVYETKRGGHCVFVDRVDKIGYRTWNRFSGGPPFFSRVDMSRALKRSQKSGELFVYIFQPLKR